MIFYTPDIATDCHLPEEESQHAVKVLRLQVGDTIELVDGKGTLYHAEITFTHPKHCEFNIISQEDNYNPQPVHLHIAIAPTKNMDRMEWFAEKATEIGITEITPLLCDHSERKVIKNERLEKILVSAMKQSKKAFLPQLNEMTGFDHFMKSHNHSNGFIAHCYEQDKRLLSSSYKAGSDVVVMIGPEGDFSEREVELAIQLGYVPVSLGKSRLRTETAGIVACHTVQLINEFAQNTI